MAKRPSILRAPEAVPDWMAEYLAAHPRPKPLAVPPTLAAPAPRRMITVPTKAPDFINYAKAVGSAVKRAPTGTVHLAQDLAELPGAAIDYLKKSTPGDVGSDIKSLAQRYGQYWQDDPASAISDVVPFLGDVKPFAEMVDAAAQARQSGDLETAHAIEEQIAPSTALNLIPEIGSLGAWGLKRATGAVRKGLSGLGRATEAVARPAYDVAEEGGNLLVKRRDLVPQPVPEARQAKTLGELRTLIGNPEINPARRIGSVPEQLPETSLARQSGIARAYQEAIADNPAYKHALFERYGETMPDVVEKAKAQNLDQLTEAAYNQLGKEVTQQFDQLPLTLRYHQGELEYPTPSAMFRDALGNANLNVFRGGDPHEFLHKIDPATGLSQNEMFRAVHDYLGHVAPGSTFRPGGEEIAYASHAGTMSPLAQMALLSETRGQNSVVNYSPLNAELTGQMNEARRRLREREIADRMTTSLSDSSRLEGIRAQRELPSAQALRDQLRELGGRTQFAEQRAVLLPPEYLDPMTSGGVPDWLRQVIQPGAPTSARGVHISRQPDLSMTDPSFYGSGHQGAEYAGVVKGGRPNRTYFYSGPEGTVNPEASVMGANPQGQLMRGPRHAYEAGLSGLYDLEKDPEGIVSLAKAYNLPDYQPVLSPNALYAHGASDIAGRSAAPDMERLLGEYGYGGYITDRSSPEQRWAAMFDPVTGLRKIERGPQGYAEGGPVA